jgi:hypothetical protein
MMACCSSLLDPTGMTPAGGSPIAQRGWRDLQFYNGDTHRAAFALPNFVRAGRLTASSYSRRSSLLQGLPAVSVTPSVVFARYFPHAAA